MHLGSLDIALELGWPQGSLSRDGGLPHLDLRLLAFGGLPAVHLGTYVVAGIHSHAAAVPEPQRPALSLLEHQLGAPPWSLGCRVGVDPYGM